MWQTLNHRMLYLMCRASVLVSRGWAAGDQASMRSMAESVGHQSIICGIKPNTCTDQAWVAWWNAGSCAFTVHWMDLGRLAVSMIRRRSAASCSLPEERQALLELPAPMCVATVQLRELSVV
jgi:hypothetical protein